MKKFFIFLLCLIILALAFSFVAKNNDEDGGARLHDIEPATATHDETDSIKEEIHPERNEETARDEIKSNLRDVRELIDAGAIEDATMIIKSLKTRDLTDSERKELADLQKMMITISD